MSISIIEKNTFYFNTFLDHEIILAKYWGGDIRLVISNSIIFFMNASLVDFDRHHVAWKILDLLPNSRLGLLAKVTFQMSSKIFFLLYLGPQKQLLDG